MHFPFAIMKIALVNRSDSTGGAAVVTHRLMQALRAEGVDARMLVLEKLTDDPHVISCSRPLIDKYNFISERWNIFLRNGFSRKNLFKADIANHGRNMASHRWIKEADVVMLNWINQGFLSLKSITRLCETGKPIVWTMHDMWPMTGVCHHALQCDGYRHVCRGCQFLDSIKVDLSTAVQSQKNKLYTLHPDIHFVAVSNWLAQCARESRLLCDMAIDVIPNAIDVKQFGYERQLDGDLGIGNDKKVIAMGAARLDDSIKGFDLLIDATGHLRKAYPQIADRLHLVLFGDIRDRSLLDLLELPYTYVGTVNGVDKLMNIYTQADIVLSTSRFETLPGTLVEGMACGCIPVSFGAGGQRDIIDHLSTGYIADEVEPEAIAKGMAWAADAAIDRRSLHDAAARKFAADVIARRYIELCENLLRK